jgi:hypothetical protein
MRSSDSRLASCSGVVPSGLAWSSGAPGWKAPPSDPGSASFRGYWPQALDPSSLPRLLPLDPLCAVHSCFLPTRPLPFAP